MLVVTACLPFPPEQQRQALAARGAVDWSAEPAGCDLSAVDPHSMRRVRRLLVFAGKDDVSRLDDVRLLGDLRLVVDGGLTRAGLLLLAGLRTSRSMAAPQLAGVSQRPAAEAQAVLERVAEAGLVAATPTTVRRPFPSYRFTSEALAGLGRAVAYHRQPVDVRDTKVVAHVREVGFITNQALRRMFDLSVHQARDVLRDLQRREVLVKVDDRAGGPGVRYGPGPAFPARRRRGVR